MNLIGSLVEIKWGAFGKHTYHRILWRLCLWGCGWLRVAGSGLGDFLLSHPRARCGVLYSDTLSARDVGWSPRPTGSLTARVLVNGGSALPRISTCLSSRPSSSVVTWDCASTLSHRLIWAEPRALAATRPLGHSLAFPHLDMKACLYRWLVYCSWSTMQRSHDITRPHSVWSHLQWLANCSYPNGRRSSPSLHLFTRT